MKKYCVFVSSTYEDLVEERREAVQAILEANCIPMGMELFPASNNKQWKVIKKVIDDCDFYLVIIAGRYGSIGVDDYGVSKSYTEMEFDYAFKKKKPIIAFYHDNLGSIPSSKTESTDSGKKKLLAFLNKVKAERLAKSWNNKDNLKYVILQSLNSVKETTDVGGWLKLSSVEMHNFDQYMSVIKSLGLVAAFDKRSIAIGSEYDNRLLKARKTIDVMGFSLTALLDDKGDEFEKWAKHASVRILLIDPNFPQRRPFANIRDYEERNTVGTIKRGVERFVEATRPLWTSPDINFEVRLSTVLPSINMFRIDDELFWGPYLLDSTSKTTPLHSRNLPTMIVNSDGLMFPRLVEHFEAIWNDPSKSKKPI